MEKDQVKNQVRKLRWGILGAGGIVDRWIRGAKQLTDEMEIVGIASRTIASAQKAAARYGIPGAYTYDELLHMDEVDVFYVATVHTAHKELAIQALRRGKAVLVEKPAAINAADFREMAECAKENHTFLMEAVWTRFFPMIRQIGQLIADGTIGDVRLIESAFSFRTEGDMNSRLFDPERAGGSLLDTGVYNLHFAQMILKKEPVELIGLSAMDTDELHLQVDEQASYIAKYDGGELAVMTSAIRTTMPDTAYIYGTKGYMVIPVFWKPTQVKVIRGTSVEELEMKVPQNVPDMEDEGYQYEIAHVNDCVRKDLKESPVMPLALTEIVLKQCDSLRKQWGLIYPSER